MPKPAAPLLAVALAAGLCLAAPTDARGQTAGAPPGGLRELALRWAEGEFRAPLICHIDGVPHRGLRQMGVTRNEREGYRPLARIAFPGLEVPPDTRCHDELGAEEPTVVGSVVITFEGRSRPDTARFDFDEALRRHGGFSYAIVAGSLRVGPPDQPVESLPEVDFRGGTAELMMVKRGSDSFRRLADFGPHRKLRLTLRAPDGTQLAFDLVQVGGR